MIEKVYRAQIADVSDALARKALLDLAPPTDDKIIPLSGRRS